MTADWEPGGLLLIAWAQLRLARTVCDPEYLLTHPIMRQALDAAHDALDAARKRAIEEEIMSYRGEDRFHIEDTSEERRGDPPEPVAEDTSAEDRAMEATQRPWDTILPMPITLPDFRTEAIDRARVQAAGVANPVTREQLREFIR